MVPPSVAAPGILSGVRILDFTQMKTGPMGTQLLGDLGADVIKVERAGTGEWERGFPAFGRYTPSGVSAFFLALNRNKRSLALDLKSEAAREIVYRLAAGSDVAVQNFRPGVMSRMGFGYQDLKRVRPDLIYCSNSGYGSTGPYVGRPGQDLLAQAVSGMVLCNGTEGQPMPVASTVADGVTSILLAFGILGALHHRLRTGEGQELEVDLLTSLMALQQEELSALLNLDPPPDFRRSESGIPAPWLAAPYGIYATSDARHLAIAMNPLDKLAGLLDLPELADAADPQAGFSGREEIRRLIATRILERPLQHWTQLLLGADIWCAPVLGLADAVEDPQVVHNQLIRRFDKTPWGPISTIAAPVRYTRTPATYRLPPPLPGQHSREILGEAGYGEREIAEFIEAGVVTEPTCS